MSDKPMGVSVNTSANFHTQVYWCPSGLDSPGKTTIQDRRDDLEPIFYPPQEMQNHLIPDHVVVDMRPQSGEPE